MKKTIYLGFFLILFPVMLIGCGKSLFAPLTINKAGFNPQLALERAEYLYLSGNIEDAEKIYLDLKEKYQDDAENPEIYYEALRGCSKCVLEKGTADSAEVLKSFFNFALALDTETFEADDEKIGAFNQYAEDFKARVWDSFTLLVMIPDTARSEADYANMSISGLFSVFASFVQLMAGTADYTSTVMAKLSEMEEQVALFNQKWAEAEDLFIDPVSFSSEYKTALKELAGTIDTLYTEILAVLSDTTDIMTIVKTDGTDVQMETANADNVLSASLDEVFTAIIEIIDGTLGSMEQIEAEAGEFYENFQNALAFA